MKEWDIGFLAFSGHKIYAPFGTGVLVASRRVQGELLESLAGACRSGEENLAGIAALGRSLVLIERIGFNIVREHEQELSRKALMGLKRIPGVRVFGVSDIDSPEFNDRIGVILLGIRNSMPAKEARKLYQNYAIATRYGCHCAHLIIKYLSNFNVFTENLQRLVVRLFPRLELQGLIRISFGLENTPEDIDLLLKALDKTSVKSESVISGKGRHTISNNPASDDSIENRITALSASITEEVYHRMSS